MTRDSRTILITTGFLLWLTLIFAPALMAEEAWQEIEHPTLDFLFASRSRPASAYRDIRLDPVSVWYPGDNHEASRLAEELRELTSVQFAAALEARGLNVVNQPAVDSGSNLLIVSIQLIDLRRTDPFESTASLAGNFRFRVVPGRVTMVAEFRDAESGRVVVRMADLQDPASPAAGAIDRMLENWGDIVAANIIKLPGVAQLARNSVR